MTSTCSGSEKSLVERGRGRNCRTGFAEEGEGGDSSWPGLCFQLQRSPTSSPPCVLQLRCPGPRWRCFGAVMPSAAGSSVPGAAAGSRLGTRALSQNPALGLLWGTQMDVCAAGRAGEPGLSPAAFKSPWRCQSSNLLPGGSAVAGNFTCPCPSCSSF